MALAQPKSSLPATQQRKRAAAEAALNAEAVASAGAAEAEAAAAAAEAEATAAAAALTAAQAGNDDSGSESVTLTRTQLNELQGASDRSARAERDAQLARMEADEARAALTAAGQSRKEQSHSDAPLDLGFAEADLALSVEEEETFGESKSFVLKLVRAECARLFKAYDARIAPMIGEARQAATEATSRVVKTAQRSFTGLVRGKVPDVDKLVGHANFKDFLDAVVPMTNMTYNAALNDAHATENLQAAVDIFDAFRLKYGVKKPSAAGYAGATPTGTQGEQQEPKGKTKHSMAERKKKGEDYRKGRISQTDFDVYKVSFDAAMKAGQVGD